MTLHTKHFKNQIIINNNIKKLKQHPPKQNKTKQDKWRQTNLNISIVLDAYSNGSPSTDNIIYLPTKYQQIHKWQISPSDFQPKVLRVKFNIAWQILTFVVVTSTVDCTKSRATLWLLTVKKSRGLYQKSSFYSCGTLLRYLKNVFDWPLHILLLLKKLKCLPILISGKVMYFFLFM